MGTILTKKGTQLLVKLMATQGNLEFTRVSIGTGSLPKGYDPASMIDLINYKMDGVISKCSADNDVATITMQISSIGVETGFTMTEIGVFANDPDIGEVLYSYLDLQEDPQYIYAESGEAEKYIEIILEVAIEESTKVTNYINPASLVTRGEFDNTILNIKEELLDEDINFDDSGEVEGINSFTDFMSSFVKNTSIYQCLANMKTGFKYLLHMGRLVNNGQCVTPGLFALDAAYGHTMTEQITQLYSEITVRYNAETKSIQFFDGENWIELKNMTSEYREQVRTLSKEAMTASIIFESVVSGDTANSVTISHRDPVYEGNLVKINYGNQRWMITARQKIYYSINEAMGGALVLDTGESISWEYTKNATYYFEKL